MRSCPGHLLLAIRAETPVDILIPVHKHSVQNHNTALYLSSLQPKICQIIHTMPFKENSGLSWARALMFLGHGSQLLIQIHHWVSQCADALHHWPEESQSSIYLTNIISSYFIPSAMPNGAQIMLNKIDNAHATNMQYESASSLSSTMMKRYKTIRQFHLLCGFHSLGWKTNVHIGNYF